MADVKLSVCRMFTLARRSIPTTDDYKQQTAANKLQTTLWKTQQHLYTTDS